VPSSRSTGVIRFGPFEVDLEEGLIRKRGVRLKLQAQPFQVLAALLENPGKAVTRDELRKRLWPDETFVDFEHGLNAAVTRLRQALGDSAERPRYIETLTKYGYRFLAGVEMKLVTAEEINSHANSETTVNLITKPKDSGARIWILGGILLAVACVIGVAIFFFATDSEAPSREPVPLTAFAGRELSPALSPDGNQVAFMWNGEKEDNFDIYVMSLSSGTPVRLTTDPADDVSPAWSPDGRSIAFIRRLGGDRGTLMLLPAAGGPEHKVTDVRDFELREAPGRFVSLAWSPDGKWIAASHRESEDSGEGLYLFSISGETRRLTSPQLYIGDHMPSFSSDGRALAFCRLSSFLNSEIYLLPLDANLAPAAAARRLTNHKRLSTSPVWSPKQGSILYVYRNNASMIDVRSEIRAIGLSGSRPRWHTLAFSDVWQITVGRHLVYSRRSVDTNIWRAKLPAAGDPPVQAEPFISSTREDEIPKYSPDGKEIAFLSTRSGEYEIWISKADGTKPIQLTFTGGAADGILNWSPDGQSIVFQARLEGNSDLFVVSVAGGAPKRLTKDISDNTSPSYSRDGRWIYFASTRSGRTEIWKMPAAGGDASAAYHDRWRASDRINRRKNSLLPLRPGRQGDPGHPRRRRPSGYGRGTNSWVAILFCGDGGRPFLSGAAAFWQAEVCSVCELQEWGKQPCGRGNPAVPFGDECLSGWPLPAV
jgi:Tol biopolymer transport system component/DNA-binding winged helix-turn-helix (wHTH) protein